MMETGPFSFAQLIFQDESGGWGEIIALGGRAGYYAPFQQVADETSLPARRFRVYLSDFPIQIDRNSSRRLR
jgi:hypothetical protein